MINQDLNISDAIAFSILDTSVTNKSTEIAYVYEIRAHFHVSIDYLGSYNPA